MDTPHPAVIDLPDGSFELPPDPRQARRLKQMIAGYGVFSIGLWAGFLAWILTVPRIPWVLGLRPMAVSFALELLAWHALKLPVLKADAIEVSSMAPLSRQRMPRSDLALIVRGQVKEQSRNSKWVKNYLFVAHDGKIAIKAPALAFVPEGVADFAQRLGVSLRGDFTVKVEDTIDPALV